VVPEDSVVGDVVLYDGYVSVRGHLLATFKKTADRHKIFLLIV
jgi:hypothetical protein